MHRHADNLYKNSINGILGPSRPSMYSLDAERPGEIHVPSSKRKYLQKFVLIPFVLGPESPGGQDVPVLGRAGPKQIDCTAQTNNVNNWTGRASVDSTAHKQTWDGTAHKHVDCTAHNQTWMGGADSSHLKYAWAIPRI